jgi:hypothetical protein
VGSRAVLDAVVKREISSSSRESNPGPSIVQPIAQRYTDYIRVVVFLTVVQIFVFQ